MALPIVEKIAKASKDAWPEVAAAMAANNRSMIELAKISEGVVARVEDYVAKGDGKIRRRKVCEETIWALANMGWLRTGPERDVIQTAKALVDSLNDDRAADSEIDMLEDELVNVVGNMPDYLTTPRTPEV